jgi:hypothetical protein
MKSIHQSSIDAYVPKSTMLLTEFAVNAEMMKDIIVTDKFANLTVVLMKFTHNPLLNVYVLQDTMLLMEYVDNAGMINDTSVADKYVKQLVV